MTANFELNAVARTGTGRGVNRRLREAGQVPAILYGAGQQATPITLDHKDLMRHLSHEAFYSHILTVRLNGRDERAVLKDVHRHPFRQAVLHIDLQRVSETDRIRMHVPLHFKGGDVAPGVKQGGGVISHLQNDVEVACLPKDLPEFIEVELSNMNLGDAIHLSNLVMPAGVELVALAHGHGAEHDLSVASCHAARVSAEETEATPAAATTAPASGG